MARKVSLETVAGWISSNCNMPLDRAEAVVKKHTAYYQELRKGPNTTDEQIGMAIAVREKLKVTPPPRDAIERKMTTKTTE